MNEEIDQPLAPPGQGYATAQAYWGPPAGWPVEPVRRDEVPGTVQAAVILTYVAAGLSIAVTLLFGLMAALVGSMILGDFAASDRVELIAMAAGGFLFSLFVHLLGCWLARQTWRRKGWARIALTAYAALSIVIGIFSIPLGVLNAGAGIAVIVLLFLQPSNDWFREG